MLFSHLHEYKYKYVIVVLLLIGITLFAVFTSSNVLETFIIKTLFKYKDKNKSEYFYPCDNFCGPKGECAINREQCVSNSECSGCIKETTLIKPNEVLEYNSSFIEGFSSININTSLPMYKSPETSSLTTDISNFATVIEKDAKIPKMNLGVDLWTKAFNYGLKLEESKLNYDFVLYPGELEYQPKYNTTETVTGMFNDIGPTAANATL